MFSYGQVTSSANWCVREYLYPLQGNKSCMLWVYILRASSNANYKYLAFVFLPFSFSLVNNKSAGAAIVGAPPLLRLVYLSVLK